jgi:4-diphosphocytidyl-2-C-methyl-D-erythritol kinase
LAPAKLNLMLGVGERRADGYHPLTTVFQAVDLWERVTVGCSPDPGVRVSVAGVGTANPAVGRVPLNRTNLAVRAAEALAEYAELEPAVDLRIDKAIPVAGGLAGGSADAAATLLACDALWDTGLTREELAELAAGLGADVPFAMMGGTALGQGRGEVLEPLTVGGPMWWVLVTRAVGLSTPEIFAAWDRRGGGGAAAGRPEGLIAALACGNLADAGRCLANDLEPDAVGAMPELRAILECGLAAGALGVVVTGSGPTVAGLAASRDAAQALAESWGAMAKMPGVGGSVIVAKAVSQGAHVLAGEIGR